MRRFFIKIFLFALPILVLSISAEILLRHLPNDYAYKKYCLDKNAANIKVLFLGSSHTFHEIDPAYIDLKSFNAGHDGQSPYYDAAILKKYSTRLTSLKYIVMPVDYPSLYGRLEEADPGRIKYYNIYYGIHTSNSLADNSELFGNKMKKNLAFLYGYYVNHISYVTCDSNGYRRTPVPNKTDLKTSGESDALRHTAASDVNFATNFRILKDMVEYAKEKDITIIFFTSPAYKTYVDNLNKTQLGRTISAVTALCKTYSKAYYYNFLRFEKLTAGDYWDSHHLNISGAKKFTQEINSIINSMEYKSRGFLSGHYSYTKD